MNRNSPQFVLGVVALLSIVFGAGVAVVHYSTAGLLARNEALHYNRILCQAFGLSVRNATAGSYAAAVSESLEALSVETPDGPMQVYRNVSGRTVGFVFSGLGFWDRIEGVLVLDDTLGTVQGIRFTDQKETPGLGARIEEPAFLAQFKDLRVAWEAAAAERVVVGPASSSAGNRVDAITGASQTSFALMRILNLELERFRNAWSVRQGGPHG